MAFPGNELPREIERKFLLKRVPDNLAGYSHEEIEQGYLAIENGGVQVRLRRKGEACSLTYKRGETTAREEREISLTPEQFDALWPATERRRLAKLRYEIPWRDHIVEVDVYRGRHEGLVVAEVEFESETRCGEFVPPDWFGDEVTGDSRYSNVVLAQQ